MFAKQKYKNHTSNPIFFFFLVTRVFKAMVEFGSASSFLASRPKKMQMIFLKNLTTSITSTTCKRINSKSNIIENIIFIYLTHACRGIRPICLIGSMFIYSFSTCDGLCIIFYFLGESIFLLIKSRVGWMALGDMHAGKSEFWRFFYLNQLS